MFEFCLFGAGRIGQIHAANLAARGDCRVRYVVDTNEGNAAKLAGSVGALVSEPETALADPCLDAVVIASPTDTHANLVMAAAKAGKAVFCEKPLALESARVAECLKVVEEAGAILAVGFNRRFDPDFRDLYQRLRAGEIGCLEFVSITSRDPVPPPHEYVRVSGGLFRDMMIHDLDMACWLLDETPASVFAVGACLVDPTLAELGDIDTAAVTLTTAGGRICQINNSRRSAYGYDQRIEVFGSQGMLQAKNLIGNQICHSGPLGVRADKPLHFFLERYARSYAEELASFVRCLQRTESPEVSGRDGQRALLLADAAQESLQTGVPVRPALPSAVCRK